MNHSKVFLMVIGILLVIAASSIVFQDELDEVCDSPNSLLFRTTNGWGCGILEGENITINYNGTIDFASNETLQSVTDRGSTTTNNITASFFFGDGSQLTNIPSGLPAGSDGQIQFNDGGSFGADGTLTWDKTNERFSVGSTSSGGTFTVNLQNSGFGDRRGLELDETCGGFRAGVGTSVSCSNDYGAPIALGSNLYGDYLVQATGDATFTVGGKSLQEGSLTIGSGSYSNSVSGVAIGVKASTNFYSLAIGSNSVVSDRYGIAIGSAAISSNSAQVSAEGGVAIGQGAVVSGNDGIAIGRYVESSGIDSIAIGKGYTSSTKFTNSLASSILFGSRDGSGQRNNLEVVFNKGVRVGATSGETNAMDGDDLYVADNTEIAGSLALGTNTWDGLSNGDINASTIYYDTLQAKSPIVMCSDLNCKVEVPELKETYYIERDANYNILSFDKALPQVVTDKFAELKAKKLTNDARNSCLAQGIFYEFNNNKCELNLQAQCESDGKSYWTGSTCLENPYLACEQALDTSWNLTSNACEYDAEKECIKKLRWNWNPETEVCSEPVIPQKTLEQMQRGCLADASTMWDKTTNKCIELRLYLAEPYTQPTGAHNAYAIGDVIKWNNKYYESIIDANVWSPSTYPAGWKEIV